MTDKTQADMLEALENLADWADAQGCRHESTHRGGAIWTICDDCGQKWADDQGGFKAYEEPQPLTRAKAILAATIPPQEVAGLTLAQIDAAFLAEIGFISTVEYNANEICRHFYVELRRRIAALAATTGAAAQPATPVTTGWPAPALMQDECRELSRSLSSKPDAKLHAREVGAAIAKERALQGMTEEAERLGLYDEPSAEVRAALAEREFVHAESSRIYARIVSVVRAGADDSTLAKIVREQVEARASTGEPAAVPSAGDPVASVSRSNDLEGLVQWAGKRVSVGTLLYIAPPTGAQHHTQAEAQVDAPEAPIWMDNGEASAWTSGWEAGFNAARAKDKTQ